MTRKKYLVFLAGLAIASYAASSLANISAGYTCATKIYATGGTISILHTLPTGTLYVLNNGLSPASLITQIPLENTGVVPKPASFNSSFTMFVPNGGKAPTVDDFNKQISTLSAPAIFIPNSDPWTIECTYTRTNNDAPATGIKLLAAFPLNAWGNGDCSQNGNSVSCINYGSR